MKLSQRLMKFDSREINSYKFALICAVLLHVALFIFLFIKFAAPHYMTNINNANIVNAVAVSSNVLNRLEKTISAPAVPYPVQPKTTLPKPLSPRTPSKQLELKQLQKEERVSLHKEMQDEIALKKKIEKIRQQETKKMQQELQREAQELKNQQRKESLEREMQNSLRMEKQQLSKDKAASQQAAQSQQNQGEIDKYKAMILQAISSNWMIPEGIDKNISCLLLVKVAPGGVVLDVILLKSSGNAVLDRSAETAVLKSSPLPVPDNSALFDSFREIKLTVRPDDSESGFAIK